MDKSLDKIIKKHVVLTALTGVAVVLLMITVTYGLYQVNHENTTDQEISLGDFNVDLTSTSGQITLSNLNPGVENETTYTFTTSNTGDYVVKYNVYFTDNTTTFLADSTNAQNYSNYSQITSANYQYIEYKLDNEGYRSLADVYDSTTGRFTIKTGWLQQNTSHNHSVRFRVSSSASNDVQGSILALNITMEASVSTPKIVTFDPQGGTVNIQSKKVTPGTQYGDLPTPARDGYTFLGWNGKNMFDEESIFMAISGSTYTNGYYNFTLGNAHNLYGDGSNPLLLNQFKDNTIYTTTISGYVDECTAQSCAAGDYLRLVLTPVFKDNTLIYYPLNSTEYTTNVYKNPSGRSISYFSISYGNGSSTYAHIKHLQIEEGSQATEFEPYYVTNTTTVTQDKDHTLKAIWKENT